MHIRWLAPFLIFGLSACDELTSTTQAVTMLTRTPDLTAADGWDPNLAAILPMTEINQAATAVLVGIGERDNLTSTTPPTPITGAQITMSWNSGANQVTICAVQDAGAEGTYSATNIPAAFCGSTDLVYTAGATYEVEITTSLDTHSASVVAPAAIDAAMVHFTPPLQPSADRHGALLPRHGANTSLAVDYSLDPQARERHAITNVVAIPFTGSDALSAGSWGEPSLVFDNAPRQPAEMINLFLGDPVTEVEIPSGVFAQTGVYFVVVTPVELSNDTDNLALGSGFIAGWGTAFVFWVE